MDPGPPPVTRRLGLTGTVKDQPRQWNPSAETEQSSSSRARTSVLLRGWETFLYTLKAGPAGGRLRRPSSAGSHHQRSDLPARAAHQFPDVGPDQPNRLGLPHDNRQRDKTGDYQQEKPGPSPVDPFTISLLLHPLILNKQGCGSILVLPRLPMEACQRGSCHPGPASPIGRAGASSIRYERGRPHRPCHLRAIPSTTPPVRHGQPRTLLTA